MGKLHIYCHLHFPSAAAFAQSYPIFNFPFVVFHAAASAMSGPKQMHRKKGNLFANSAVRRAQFIVHMLET